MYADNDLRRLWNMMVDSMESEVYYRELTLGVLSDRTVQPAPRSTAVRAMFKLCETSEGTSKAMTTARRHLVSGLNPGKTNRC